MRELRVSDELKFEEYDGRLYLIMSERTPHRYGHTTPDRSDSTIMFTPAQAASLRDFLNAGVSEKVQEPSAGTQSRNALAKAVADRFRWP